MTTLARIAVAILMAILMSSCNLDINLGNGKKGNGILAQESRKVTNDFTVVSASEGIMVYVTQAKEFSIEVEADENIIDLIGTDIKDGKLRIHAIENIGRATKKVHVSLPEVSALESSSGAHLTSKNTIEAERLDLDASSGAIFEVEIDASEVNIDASSGANIKVSGKSDTAEIDASSGANIKAKELLSKVCDASASSGANLGVNASETLTAKASSGGNIGYKGNPTVSKSKAIGGSIHKD